MADSRRTDLDRALADAVRRGLPALGERELRALVRHAQRHGLDEVLLDRAGPAASALPAAVRSELAMRSAARACDHAAHMTMLRQIDGALADARLDAVVLKGALLGERLYDRPGSRPTSDIDLLVREADLEPATRALAGAGYVASDDPEEERFRAEGHHLHLLHPAAPTLELHFHAFRGFGGVLRSEPLLERSTLANGYARLRVLEPADELLYLAVHAAGHRFMRLGWLYDLFLLLGKTPASGAVVDEAYRRARITRMTRPLALALHLLAELFDRRASSPEDAHALVLRKRLLAAITEEPNRPLWRAATRFLYTLALCEDLGAARSYAESAIVYRLRAQTP